MNSWKLSSSEELTVKPTIKTSKLETFTKHVSTKLRAIFSKQSSSKELILIPTNPNILVENKMNPLEELINQVTNKVNQLPDESIIAIALRMYAQFWDWKQWNREIEMKFINSDIMPLIWKDERLPTIFIGNGSMIIERFWIIIKEKLDTIRQRKLAELMNYISIRVDQLPNNYSIVELVTTLNSVLWKRTNWNNQFKVEYINYPLMSFLKINEHLPEILEKDADMIIEWFLSMMKRKASSILQKKRDKLIARISRSK